MQKESLTLNTSIDKIPGIGPKRAAALRQLGLFSVEHLLGYLPRTYLDKSFIKSIIDLKPDEYVSTVGLIASVAYFRNRLTVVMADASGKLTLCWFRSAEYLKSKFQKGERITCSGKVTQFRGKLQMVHPEFEILTEEKQAVPPGIRPIYSITEALRKNRMDSRQFQKIMTHCFDNLVDELPEKIPKALLVQKRFEPLKTVYAKIHFPDDLSNIGVLKKRLSYEELFFFLLKIFELKKLSEQKGTIFKPAPDWEETVLKKIPFKLTGAQNKVLSEIKKDLNKPTKMHRLLQGDVGSGKTIVMVLGMLPVLAQGDQVAIMAPTEILADQHFHEISNLLEDLPVPIDLIVGSMPQKKRDELNEKIISGKSQVLVGTHALISQSTDFKRLKLIIIDEQHRFGVHQRLSLSQKGLHTEMLVVSATPIPRTLALTLYGDLELSVIDEMPKGRKPVKTFYVNVHKQKDMIPFIGKKIKEGNQVFYILPLVSESEKLNEVKSAETMAATLSKGVLGKTGIGLMHGRLKPKEKEKVMHHFKSGKFKTMVSTTVVEVGVNIPQANIMVIENAERFGLSQLHQLRGRIGRGGKESFCFLIPGKEVAEESQHRLHQFCSTNDGFKIAEMDFENRGPGEMTGLRQAGMPEFRFVNLLRDQALISEVKQDVAALADGQFALSDDELNKIKKELAAFNWEQEKILQTG